MLLVVSVICWFSRFVWVFFFLFYSFVYFVRSFTHSFLFIISFIHSCIRFTLLQIFQLPLSEKAAKKMTSMGRVISNVFDRPQDVAAEEERRVAAEFAAAEAARLVAKA